MSRLCLGVIALSLAAPVAIADAKKRGDDTLSEIDAQIAKANVDKSEDDWKTNVPKPTVVQFDPETSYFARMKTNKGTMRIQFLPDVAPMHVTSFIYLTRMGFYDGLTFHRVIPDFMAQGGCPLGTGSGGPGYRYDGEYDPKVKHDRAGMLSTANSGPGTDGSQFFITFKATPWLNGKHTVFGEVVDGMDVVRKLERAGSRSGQTTEPLEIEKVTIEVE